MMLLFFSMVVVVVFVAVVVQLGSPMMLTIVVAVARLRRRTRHLHSSQKHICGGLVLSRYVWRAAWSSRMEGTSVGYWVLASGAA